MNLGHMLDGVNLDQYQYATPTDELLASAAGWAQSFYFRVAERSDGKAPVSADDLMASAPFAFSCKACLYEWIRRRLAGVRMSWEEIDRTFQEDAKRIKASGKFVPEVMRRIMVNDRPDWIGLTPTQYLPSVRKACESWHEEIQRQNIKDNAKKEGERV